MRRGDWEAAWRQTDRIELPRRERARQPGFVRASHHLLWDGTPFEGRRVLVRCEHGLGDTLQFIRFLPPVAAMARELKLQVQPALLPLLQRAPGLGEVSNAWVDGEWPAHDVAAEVMELAYAFRCTAADVPPPYPHLAARVRGRVPVPDASRRFRVGLLWASSDWDTERSIPPASLETLLAVQGVRFYSLQQGRQAGELGDGRVVQLASRTQAIEDAASAMLEMDLVICVDGMPAHLAGTLGVPVWLLLKQVPDWRWGVEGETTPWYPSMRLFRQARAGEWEAPLAKVASELVFAALTAKQWGSDSN